jgi:hypothetical protein
MRAVARELEERNVLAARPGRTADELAREAGAAIAAAATALRAAARSFDTVVYGRRDATADHYAQVRAADHAVTGSRDPAGRT